MCGCCGLPYDPEELELVDEHDSILPQEGQVRNSELYEEEEGTEIKDSGSPARSEGREEALCQTR